MRRTGRRDDAQFGQMGAQGVDRLCSLTNQKVAGPVSHRRCLLRFALYGNEPHGRP